MISRRRIAAVLAVTPLAAQVSTPPTTPKAPPGDASIEKAKDGIRRASERLAKLEVPMDVEPAFAFKP